MSGTSLIKKEGYSRRISLPILPNFYPNVKCSSQKRYKLLHQNLIFFEKHKSKIIQKFKNMWFSMWKEGSTWKYKTDSSSWISVASGSPLYAVTSFGIEQDHVFQEDDPIDISFTVDESVFLPKKKKEQQIFENQLIFEPVTEEESVNLVWMSLSGVSLKRKKGFSERISLPSVPNWYTKKYSSQKGYKIFHQNLDIFHQYKSKIIQMFQNMWFAIWREGYVMKHKVGSSLMDVVTGSTPDYAVKSFGINQDHIFRKDEVDLLLPIQMGKYDCPPKRKKRKLNFDPSVLRKDPCDAVTILQEITEEERLKGHEIPVVTQEDIDELKDYYDNLDKENTFEQFEEMNIDD